MLEYSCICTPKGNAKGFINTRKPQLVQHNLELSFCGIDSDNITAIFTNELGDSLYRTLVDGLVTIPKDFLYGEIKVSAYAINPNSASVKYECEPICVERAEGAVWVYVESLDYQEQVVKLYEELKVVVDSMTEYSNKIKQLDDKISTLIDGHDFE